MGLEKREGMAKQVILYLASGESGKALELAHRMSVRFPDDMLSHYLLSKSMFASGNHVGSIASARKAFALSSDRTDMLACAILAASAYYRASNITAGRAFLEEVGARIKDPDLEELMVVFSLALHDEEGSKAHFSTLARLDRLHAKRLLERLSGE